MPGLIYYKGQQVTQIPETAYAEWSERLSNAWSRYFAQHPEEYEDFLKKHGGADSVVISTKRKKA